MQNQTADKQSNIPNTFTGKTMQLPQCHGLTAKIDCTFTVTKGRAWKVKASQKFWVTSAFHNNSEGCMIDRKGKGFCNSGLYLTNSQILEVFAV